MSKILKAIKNIIYCILIMAFIFFIFCYTTSSLKTAGENGTGSTEEEYTLRIPKLGYLIEYAGTKTGSILCIAMPCVILIYNSLVDIIDFIHNSSKHRKMILRQRKRRKDRYIKEGLYV